MGAALDLQSLELAQAANRAFEMVRHLLSQPTFSESEREALSACEDSLEKVANFAVLMASHASTLARRHVEAAAAGEMRAVAASVDAFRPQTEHIIIEEMRDLRARVAPGESFDFLGRVIDHEERARAAFQLVREVFLAALSNLEERAKSDPVLRALVAAPVDDEPITEDEDALALEAFADIGDRRVVSHADIEREWRERAAVR